MIIALLAIAAAALLAVGVLLPEIALTYISLGLAILGLVIVMARIVRQRRKRVTDTAERHGDDSADPATSDNQDEHVPAEEDDAEPVPDDAPGRVEGGTDCTAEVPAGGPETVLVIAGRRRFHRKECALTSGRSCEEVTVAEAREEGFTPCSTCKPGVEVPEEHPVG
jgi:hypothetical protein